VLDPPSPQSKRPDCQQVGFRSLQNCHHRKQCKFLSLLPQVLKVPGKDSAWLDWIMGTTLDLSYGVGDRMRELNGHFHSDAMARKTGSRHLKKVCLNHLHLVQRINLRCYYWMYFDTCISPYDLHNHMPGTMSYFSHPKSSL